MGNFVLTMSIFSSSILAPSKARVGSLLYIHTCLVLLGLLQKDWRDKLT